jgi:hypothetical protein
MMNTQDENNTSLSTIVSKLKEKENKKRKSSENEPINIFMLNESEKNLETVEVVVSMEERRRRSQRQYNGISI